MAITKEQWESIEFQLSIHYGEVRLVCDGYEVTAQIQSAGPLKQVIAVYVNGYIKGEWMTGGHEESRKFYQERKSYLYSAKEREEAAKEARRRYQTAETRKFWQNVATAQVTVYSPNWKSPKSFTRHLRKTCTDIEVVSIGYGS